MVVGAADLETWEITHREGGRYFMPDANDAGRTRPERAETLARALEEPASRVRFDLVPNMSHDGMKAIDTVEDFFADILRRPRARDRRRAGAMTA